MCRQRLLGVPQGTGQGSYQLQEALEQGAIVPGQLIHQEKKSFYTYGNQRATSPRAEGQELIIRVNNGKKLFRAIKMRLNVESARKRYFKKKVKIQVKFQHHTCPIPQVSQVLLDPNQQSFVESCTALNSPSSAGRYCGQHVPSSFKTLP